MFKYILFFIPFLIQCSDPVDFLNKEIKRVGYIPYTTPLSFAGTGTLIGGSPKQMAVVSSPDTCFPPELVDGLSLRQRDDSTLPYRNEHYYVNTDVIADFFKALANGNLTVRAGVKVKDLKQIELRFNGVHIEYIDSVKLIEFYRQHMTEHCKDYLDRVGFVIQAIVVDEMHFTFYHKNNGQVEIDVNNIKQFLDISADVDWEIERNVTVVIKTPKFIGYQLGTLHRRDEGLSLYRASRTKMNKWKFEEVAVFPKDP